MLHPVPWNEEATLTRRRPGHDPVIALVGPLRTVLQAVEARASGERAQLRISFAERGCAPFEYLPEHFDELIGRMRLQG